MPENRISLTDFVDFVTRAGMPKLTKVKQLKHRGEYGPYSDFYRPFREAVIAAHAERRGKASIPAAALPAVAEDRRRHHFNDLCAGYLGWWGRQELDYFPPPTALVHREGLDISVNPELGLLIDGRPHVVKLYFKEPPLSKRYAEVVACLMHETLAGQAPTGGLIALLDVRRRRLHRLSPRPDLSILVAGEMAALTTMWARA
ncbi:MAG TPA: hypothetical protein PKW35_18530 [Nannocystaceae bacterium]|nr:hypothetical protein [Nannocystaceae bacterium]